MNVPLIESARAKAKIYFTKDSTAKVPAVAALKKTFRLLANRLG